MLEELLREVIYTIIGIILIIRRASQAYERSLS
jgi:hypothetical protein